MTPMIDVVFELIIFFVVTIKQENIFSRLNCNRPAPDTSTSTSEPKDDTPCNIEIGKGYNANGVLVYNKTQVSLSQLADYLKKTAKSNKDTPVIIKCATNSPHKALVDVLDLCYFLGLYSVSVFTL